MRKLIPPSPSPPPPILLRGRAVVHGCGMKSRPSSYQAVRPNPSYSTVQPAVLLSVAVDSLKFTQLCTVLSCSLWHTIPIIYCKKNCKRFSLFYSVVLFQGAVSPYWCEPVSCLLVDTEGIQSVYLSRAIFYTVKIYFFFFSHYNCVCRGPSNDPPPCSSAEGPGP
jgi:hypothetical protein